MPFLGVHVSIKGGVQNSVKRAEKLYCKSFQIFTKTQLRWEAKPLPEKEIMEFLSLYKASQITCAVSHCGYLINPASPDKSIREKSIHALRDEIHRANQLNLEYAVVHPGSHKGEGVNQGIKNIITAVKNSMDKGDTKVKLLFETTAGSGNTIGSSFEELSQILEGLMPDYNVGICLDTAHIFGAGYDISSKTGYEKTISCIRRTTGLENIHVIHINDSKVEMGSRKDRHDHIGKGLIGLPGFKRILNEPAFKNLPFILETPKEDNDDQADIENLNTLKSLIC